MASWIDLFSFWNVFFFRGRLKGDVAVEVIMMSNVGDSGEHNGGRMLGLRLRGTSAVRNKMLDYYRSGPNPRGLSYNLNYLQQGSTTRPWPASHRAEGQAGPVRACVCMHSPPTCASAMVKTGRCVVKAGFHKAKTGQS